MDERAQIPVTLPVREPTASCWQDPPAEIANHRSTAELPESVDVVVIGSGISGSSIAYKLLNHSGSRKENKEGGILMLEARTTCSGATGRNGGHTKGASYRYFAKNAQELGEDEALKIARLEYACMREQHAFIREKGIECDLLSCDTVDIIYDDKIMEESIVAVERMRALLPGELEGVGRYTVHSAEEARERFLCKGKGWAMSDGSAGGSGNGTEITREEGEAVGAISYPAGSLSAYKFVIGILKLCLQSATFNLQTTTPATAIKRDENNTGLWRVSTTRGTVTARKVVLATNAYTGYLHRGFQGAIVPVRGQISAQRPGRAMPQAGLETTYSFIYAQGYDYMISRPRGAAFEGDIVIGGGLTVADGSGEGLGEYGTLDDSAAGKSARVGAYLAASAARAFGASWGGDSAEGRVRREWTGIMGYSPDGFPFVGEVPGERGLWVSASFQGHGMVLCFKCAEGLVGMMEGEEEGLGKWFPQVYRVTRERMGTNPRA